MVHKVFPLDCGQSTFNQVYWPVETDVLISVKCNPIQSAICVWADGIAAKVDSFYKMYESVTDI